MKLAICVVSPPNYPHSEAFREVAQTLESGARALGHDVVATTTTNLPDRQTIILGANLLKRYPQPLRDDAILYNLEQVQAGPWFDEDVVALWRRYRVWDYSNRNADALERMGLKRPRVVPVGWAPELTRIVPTEADIDVLFYGSINQRRQAVIDALRRAGVRVETLFGVYGKERDAYVARSRLVLNVHFFEAKVFEVVRVAYLLANGRAVVSERGSCPEEEAEFESGVAFANYDDLVPRCLELLAHPEEREALGRRGQALIEARPVTEALRRALEEEPPAVFVPVPAAKTRLGARVVGTHEAPPWALPEGEVPAYYNWSRPEIVSFVQAQGLTVLDVGCAAGAMGQALLESGAREVVGLERVTGAVAFARRRLTAVYEYDLEGLPELPYPKGYFDVITFADVLEHLSSPETVVRHLVNWLKPGGKIVCSIPNVRHQEVVLSLLVHGDWQYADAGILDKTHLRFFTLKSIQRFCVSVGLAMQSDVRATVSQPLPEREELCRLVGALGGDAEAFRRESVVVQYIFSARSPVDRAAAVCKPLLDPWRGSQPTRLLLAPNLENSEDQWQQLLLALATKMEVSSDVTVGVALPMAQLREPPLAIREAADTGQLDLLLMEVPSEPDGYARLLAGASALLATGSLTELRRLAESVGVPVIEAATLLS